MTKFEVGKSYATRSICDSECIIRVHVVSRTAKTIKAHTSKGERVLRINEYQGIEQVSPWGRYSMSPIVDATDLVRMD